MNNCIIVIIITLNVFLSSLLLGSELEAYQNMDTAKRVDFFKQSKFRKLSKPNNFFNVFMMGLSDEDPSVRKYAGMSLSFVISGLQNSSLRGQEIPWDLSIIVPDLQNSIISNIQTSDDELKGALILSLAYSDSPNKKIEDVLLDVFTKEKNGELRGTILKTLAFVGYESDQFKSILVESLESENRDLLYGALKAVAIVRPDDALSKLLDLLTKKNVVKDNVVQAIAAYGQKAQPYLQQLEQLMNDPRIGGTLPGKTRKAIEQIKKPEKFLEEIPQSIQLTSLINNQSEAKSFQVEPKILSVEPKSEVIKKEEPVLVEKVEQPELPQEKEKKSPLTLYLIGIVALVGIYLATRKKKS
tara:strand:+ start:742 stop:1812 length:1071 start_codon:yes stop_codon:yes gene_type:complete